ncbi:MAG: hypothetical protein ACPG77_12885, partial [Nannocystaceae bacterium]
LRPPRGGFVHGHARSSDRRPGGEGGTPPEPAKQVSRMRGLGLPLLLAAVMGVLTLAGILRVQNRTAVLESGARITDLAAEHARLLDQRRRLEAERAYLRHPDHVQAIAVERLEMVPATPDRIQKITLKPAPKQPSALDRLRDSTYVSAGRPTP